MSMFHELMMRKKGQIMYATIKGTLTENDGVFSGFSTSNYLQLQQNIELNNFEFAITFKTASDISSYSGYLLTNATNNTFYVDFNYNRFRFRTVTAEDTTDAYTWWINLDSETFYKLIWKYDVSTTTHTYTLIKNGVIVGTQTHIATFKGITDIFNFGASANVNSIDLPNSYIKLGATKYNLQAVVGYTIVGSPTITDGVVRGFSSSDYLTLPIFAPTERWKFIVGFTYSSQNTGTCYIAGNVDSFLVKTYNNALQCALKVMGSSSFDFSASIGKTLSDGEKCYCSIEFTGTIYKFSWSSDGINWTLGNTYTSKTNIRTDRGIYYGRVSNTVWLGTIIIKDSLIYQNNKLWFNGQPS